MDKTDFLARSSLKRKMKSIQSKLLMLVIGVMITLALCIGIVSFLSANNILHRNARAVLSATCTSESEKLNSILIGISTSVEIMENHMLSELDSVEHLHDKEFLSEYTKEMEELFSIIAENTNDIVAYYVRFTPEITDSTCGFFYSKEKGKTDELKLVPTTDLSLYDESDIEHVGWYYEPIKAGHAIWMPPYYNQNNGFTMISYVVPLYKDGTLFGIVGMDVDFDLLTNTAADIKIYENGCAHLLDENGQKIYNAGNHDMKTGDFIETANKLENGMYLMTGASYFDIQRAGIYMMILIFATFIVIMAISIIFTVLATRRIVRPLQKLTMATQDLAQDKPVDYLDFNSDDEIGMLAHTFKETSEKLHTYIGYINTLAYNDSLTGVKNSTSYIEKMHEIENIMGSGGLRFGVFVADINDLKLTNDEYGHEIGNDLIVETAKILTETFGNNNVYRIGGDEFAAILIDDELDRRDELLAKFDTMCKNTFITVANKSIFVSASRGVSVYDPEKDKTFEDVFNRADRNMYLHKHSNKNNNRPTANA